MLRKWEKMLDVERLIGLEVGPNRDMPLNHPFKLLCMEKNEHQW